MRQKTKTKLPKFVMSRALHFKFSLFRPHSVFSSHLSFGVFFPYNWDTVNLVGFLKRRKVLGIYIDIEKAWEAKTSNIRRCCICYRKFLRALWSRARQAHYGVKWFFNPISSSGGILFIALKVPECIYNLITAMEFSAMFIFQLDAGQHQEVSIAGTPLP